MSATRDDLAARRASKAAAAAEAQRQYDADLNASIRRHPAGRKLPNR